MNDKSQFLSSLYQSQANESPSEQLNDKIMALAKEQAKINKKSQAHINNAPYSIAASIMVLGLLVLNFPNFYQTSIPANSDNTPVVSATEKSAEQLTANTYSQHKKRSLTKPQAMPVIPTAELMADISPVHGNAAPMALLKKQTPVGINKYKIAYTSEQKVALKTVAELIKSGKTLLALNKLKLVKKEWPDMTLPVKYQQLLDNDN